MEGTITWIKIVEGNFPPRDTRHSMNINPMSVDVLMLNQDNKIEEGFYIENTSTWKTHANKNFNPTHYAIINYPTD